MIAIDSRDGKIWRLMDSELQQKEKKSYRKKSQT